MDARQCYGAGTIRSRNFGWRQNRYKVSAAARGQTQESISYLILTTREVNKLGTYSLLSRQIYQNIYGLSKKGTFSFFCCDRSRSRNIIYLDRSRNGNK
jgi:hypothetical protein